MDFRPIINVQPTGVPNPEAPRALAVIRRRNAKNRHHWFTILHSHGFLLN